MADVLFIHFFLWCMGAIFNQGKGKKINKLEKITRAFSSLIDMWTTHLCAVKVAVSNN